MKVSIYSNHTEDSNRVSDSILKLIEQTDLVIDDDHPDVVITVGGDGTLLSAFHHYTNQIDHIRFVGVHTGHLGFYTDWRDFEVSQLVEGLVSDNGQKISYPLVEVDIIYTDGSKNHFTSLNESTVKKVENTMVCDIYLKGELFERFRGDGLCISTPTGSTGYNKSVGGAVIDPSLVGLQLSEIASINNRVFRTLGSPIIVGKDQYVDLVLNSHERLIVSADNGQAHDLDNQKEIAKIHYEISDHQISFARYRHTSFWKRVDEAFIGGIK